MSDGCIPGRAFLIAAAAAWTDSASKFVPLLPPRRITWTSWFPRVFTIAANPCSVTPINACGELAARIASTATPTDPSVPFLNPIGKETPDASSLCNCDSVVRAPMAPQEMRSAMYWGEIVSRSSDPTGTPRSVRAQRSCLATRRPLLILKEPSMSGSFMRPFHPTVVRGFCLGRIEHLV